MPSFIEGGSWSRNLRGVQPTGRQLAVVGRRDPAASVLALAAHHLRPPETAAQVAAGEEHAAHLNAIHLKPFKAFKEAEMLGRLSSGRLIFTEAAVSQFTRKMQLKSPGLAHTRAKVKRRPKQ